MCCVSCWISQNNYHWKFRNPGQALVTSQKKFHCLTWNISKAETLRFFTCQINKFNIHPWFASQTSSSPVQTVDVRSRAAISFPHDFKFVLNKITFSCWFYDCLFSFAFISLSNYGACHSPLLHEKREFLEENFTSELLPDLKQWRCDEERKDPRVKSVLTRIAEKHKNFNSKVV